MLKRKRQSQGQDAGQSQGSSTSATATPRSSNIVPLDYGFSDGQIIYTLPITVGSDAVQETYSVLLDTGSADLWLADSNCKTDSCSSTSAGEPVKKISPQRVGAHALDKSFEISYIGGSVSGSIYAQDITIGTSKVASQAFGSATSIDNEPLSSMNVSGILGLSVPANSVIQSDLTGDDTGNSLDTSASDTGDILTGLWSASGPGKRLFGVGLQRLPSDGGGRTANSSLSLGGIDPAYVPSTANISYTPALADANGLAHHWKLYVSGFTATINGTAFSIPASFVGQTTVNPTAVLDSGAPLSYAPASLLNAVYGAFVDPSTNQRIGPGDNGVYYVPCTLPLNLTLTVGGFTVPLHPLDASLSQSTGDTSGSPSSACIGSFQAVTQGSPAGADIVLGAPFLRSVYSIYSCDGSTDAATCAPQIALHPLTTNSTQAFDEFNQVRVQRQALGSNSAYGINGATINSSGGLSAGAKIAIGIVVALVGLIALFGFTVWFARKRAAAAASRKSGGGPPTEYHDKGSSDDVRDGPRVQSGVATLSAKEQAQLREAALLHGFFDEDIVGTDSTADRSLRPSAGIEPEWDVSSRGYADALRVKREYMERHPSIIELHETHRGAEEVRRGSATTQSGADSAEHFEDANANPTAEGSFYDRHDSVSSSRRNLMS
ncbi:unnamed protein product [Parajaminaea phylloscopi]